MSLSFVAIDFETNGAQLPNGKMDVENQEPVEVAIVRVVDDEIVSMFNTLIYYDGAWTDSLAKGHHSSDSLLKGMDSHTASTIIWQMTAGETIVAYNALFDVRVAHSMLRPWFHADATHWADNISTLDPLTIARDRFGGKHNLGVVCQKYGVPLTDAHRAMDDVEALVELTLKMHEEKDITEYINVIGYKRQYGEPDWVPNNSIVLKPQGNETMFHHKDGTTEQRTRVGRPHAPVRPRPAPPSPN